MKTYQAQIDIDAPPEVVWGTLVDFANYPQWNPFIREATGEVVEGGLITIRVARVPRSLPAIIRTVNAPHELTWEAAIPFNAFFPRYIRRLERLPGNRTRFINREEFRGVLIPFVRPGLDLLLKPLYIKSGMALKAYVEAR